MESASTSGASDSADARWQRIVRSATSAFLRDGYSGAALDDIALAAGVSKATIYHYFNGKDDLFASVVTSNILRVIEGLESILDRGRSMDEVLSDYAVAYAERMAADVGEGNYYDLIRLLVETSFVHVETSRRCIAILQAKVGEPLQHYISDKIKSGELADRDPAFLTTRLLQLLFFTIQLVLAPTSRLPLEEYRRQAREGVRLFLDGARV